MPKKFEDDGIHASYEVDQTEEIIQKNINILKKEITIIAIAHRLNTIKKCDIIYKFENGRIVDQGKYHDLFPESRG